jgi:hypothetical protein
MDGSLWSSYHYRWVFLLLPPQRNHKIVKDIQKVITLINYRRLKKPVKIFIWHPRCFVEMHLGGGGRGGGGRKTRRIEELRSEMLTSFVTIRMIITREMNYFLSERNLASFNPAKSIEISK